MPDQQEEELRISQINSGREIVLHSQLTNNDNASADTHLALIRLSGGNDGSTTPEVINDD